MKKIISLLVMGAIILGSLGFRGVSAANVFDELPDALPAIPAT